MTHSKKIKFKINFTSLRKGRASGYFKNTVTMKKPEPALSRISDELKLKIISALGEIEAPGFIDLLEKLLAIMIFNFHAEKLATININAGFLLILIALKTLNYFKVNSNL